ncbi:PTS galactitol transporter subunit IIB [Enterococcus saccharolyticus]|uniref:PTS galactitol transporter subunit IIB n=1 Tax=Candidatus Enterococcus willemsii TaxID=1857215 RepID=A0ABQ6YZG9_9ENTE|nr:MULTISPECIES: PTS galactitol transporter subunit IIB [Enterococcus]KAF1304024.1 PTS galactitol transporter subunit IIB [Enterococcus sp. CU12B]MCD5002116.1 PTS galactitol transporter subunit IIB [Enterococcus saccharolyticus]
MKKRIIVACGGAIATSTVAANRIRELLQANGIDGEVKQTRITELDSEKDGADLIVTTAKVKKDFGVPTIHGVAFISGIGIDKLEQQILDALK